VVSNLDKIKGYPVHTSERIDYYRDRHKRHKENKRYCNQCEYCGGMRCKKLWSSFREDWLLIERNDAIACKHFEEKSNGKEI